MGNRFVMQDTKDPRAFTLVERYAHESVSATSSFQHHPMHHPLKPLYLTFRIINTIDTKTESKVPPREPLLANFRQVRYPSARQGYGFAPPE
jgi:hypothetical protein